MNILLIFPGFIIALIIVLYYEYKIRNLRSKLKNKVHFYVARDKNTLLYLYLGKPKRSRVSFIACEDGYCILCISNSPKFDLNPNDFKDLKWEDEPVEVFLNLED